VENAVNAGNGQARERFASAIARPQIDLTEASLLIAAEEYPGLDVAAYARRIDEIASRGRARLAGAADGADRVRRFHAFLFHDEGFRGNEADYYDPKNSFLNDVLERKLGIPISLAIVYLEVARRLGLPVHGVGFPGHFLTKWELDDGPEIVADPFHGAIVAEADCRKILQRLSGGQIAFRKELLAPLPARGILVRMLANLKGVWVRKGDLLKGVAASDRILLLAPEATTEYRDRGLLWLKLECFRPALADLESYLERATDASDLAKIEEQVAALRVTASRIS
jgi:regulator of sirC expression with transglutaminase-like and TPR domain